MQSVKNTAVDREILARSRSDHLLNDDQYRKLRKSMSKAKVVAFEKTLRQEINERDSQTFIPSSWIHYRVQGYEPKQIHYDMCNIFR